MPDRRPIPSQVGLLRVLACGQAFHFAGRPALLQSLIVEGWAEKCPYFGQFYRITPAGRAALAAQRDEREGGR